MNLFESGSAGAFFGLVAGLFWVLARCIGRAQWHNLARRLARGAVGGAVGGAVAGLVHTMVLPGPHWFIGLLMLLIFMMIGAGVAVLLVSEK